MEGMVVEGKVKNSYHSFADQTFHRAIAGVLLRSLDERLRQGASSSGCSMEQVVVCKLSDLNRSGQKATEIVIVQLQLERVREREREKCRETMRHLGAVQFHLVWESSSTFLIPMVGGAMVLLHKSCHK